MIKHIRPCEAVAGALVVCGLAISSPASAHSWHRHRPPTVAAPAPAPPRPAHSFYPETVEGGVPGNLSFNNQLRKFSDPLNANGGR